MGRLIVERSTIMNCLFSKHSCRPESEAVLTALTCIFSAYTRRMRKTKEGEDLYSWVSNTSLDLGLTQYFTHNSVWPSLGPVLL